MNKRFTDEEIVKAAHCCTEDSCETCPLRGLGAGFEKCVAKFSEYIANNTKNEPAPAATDTSSEVSTSDTKKENFNHLDDSTLLDICQAVLAEIVENCDDSYSSGYAQATLDVVEDLRGGEHK